ncbi:MAG: hypothetical protein J6V66_02120 [Clostridia bacterium]|nr:hypothetical protein [Clostridia bacterium]
MIIAIKEKDRVVVGFTNECWSGIFADKDYLDEDNIAIKFIGEDKIYAFANMNRASDILLNNQDFIDDEEVGAFDVPKYFIPFLKHQFKENGYSYKPDNWDNALVLCNNSTIYVIEPSFGFYEAEDYACHGYNTEILKSVLDETKHLPAEERIIKAVSFSTKINKCDLFPLILADTKTRKFKYILKGEDF